jgi:putative flippase GtrA
VGAAGSCALNATAQTPLERTLALREFIAYGLATCLAFALDLAVLTLLVSQAHLHYALAAALSFMSGGALLYFLSVRFVFRFRRLVNRPAEFSSFIAIGLIGVAIQTAVMLIAVESLHVHYLLGKIAAAGCTFVTNYLLRRTLLFSPGKR